MTLKMLVKDTLWQKEQQVDPNFSSSNTNWIRAMDRKLHS